jgi:hypothetical protein
MASLLVVMQLVLIHQLQYLVVEHTLMAQLFTGDIFQPMDMAHMQKDIQVVLVILF